MSFFSPVDAVLKKYHAEHDIREVEISVDLLKPIFQDIGYVDKIIWERFDLHTDIILAQIKTYKQNHGVYTEAGKYARIQYSSVLNHCWTRFILCKEMYHCIIDDDNQNKTRTTDELILLADHLTNSFLEVLSDEQDEIETFHPYETERSAEIMALETLFPIELRRVHLDDYDAGLITDYQLALRYKIPEAYVQLAMSDRYFSSVLRGRILVDIP